MLSEWVRSKERHMVSQAAELRPYRLQGSWCSQRRTRPRSIRLAEWMASSRSIRQRLWRRGRRLVQGIATTGLRQGNACCWYTHRRDWATDARECQESPRPCQGPCRDEGDLGSRSRNPDHRNGRIVPRVRPRSRWGTSPGAASQGVRRHADGLSRGQGDNPWARTRV